MRPHRLFLVVFVALLLIIGVEVAVYFFTLSPKPAIIRTISGPCTKPTPIPNAIDPRICEKVAQYQQIPNNQIQIYIIQQGKLSLVTQNYINNNKVAYVVRFMVVDNNGEPLQDYAFKKGELLVYTMKDGKKIEGKVTDLKEGQRVIVKTGEDIKTFTTQPAPQISNEVTIMSP